MGGGREKFILFSKKTKPNVTHIFFPKPNHVATLLKERLCQSSHFLSLPFVYMYVCMYVLLYQKKGIGTEQELVISTTMPGLDFL